MNFVCIGRFRSSGPDGLSARSSCLARRVAPHPFGGILREKTPGVDAGTRPTKKTQEGAKKSSEIEHVEEDRRRKCTIFIPANLHDYQNDAGIGTNIVRRVVEARAAQGCGQDSGTAGRVGLCHAGTGDAVVRIKSLLRPLIPFNILRIPVLRWGPHALVMAVTVAAATSALAEDWMPPNAQIEHAARSVWSRGGNDRPLCVSYSVRNSEQQGVQELQQNFAPGQWVVRLATRTRIQEIAKLDYFAKIGLLDRREAFINLGPIVIEPALEYRPTLAGWVQNIARASVLISPCFYYGKAQVLRILDYAESEKDAEGFSKVKINFVHGADGLVDWARTDEAIALFPEIKESLEGRRGTWTFYRAPGGKLTIERDQSRYIDDLIFAEPVGYPDIATARESVERSQKSLNPQQGFALPSACLPLAPKDAVELWRKGDSQAAAAAVLKFPPTGESTTAFRRAKRTYMRLIQLQRVGLVRVKGDPARGEVVVRPTNTIRPLLGRYGNCLPLGETRIEVVGIISDDATGPRKRFKARYIVERPAPWIVGIRDPRQLPDLAAVLEHGQPFEGTILKMAHGWGAAYIEDLRPEAVPATLSAVGAASSWRNMTERDIAHTSVREREIHAITAYSGAGDRKASATSGHATTRADVVVNPSERPIAIVLIGYEPIRWRIHLRPRARVHAVVAVGYYEQTVSGISSTTVLVRANTVEESRVFRATTGLGTYDRGTILSMLHGELTSVQQANGAMPAVIGFSIPNQHRGGVACK